MKNKLHDKNLTEFKIAELLYEAFGQDFRGEKFHRTYIEISSTLKNNLSTWDMLFEQMKKNNTLFFSFENIPSELFQSLNEKETVDLVEMYLSLSNAVSIFFSKNFPSQTIITRLPQQSATNILSNTTTGIYPVRDTSKINYIKKINNELNNILPNNSKIYKEIDVSYFSVSSIPSKLYHPIFKDVYEQNKTYLLQFQKEKDFLENFLIVYEKHVMKNQNSENLSTHKHKVTKF